jgi:hypothetical protein
MLAIQAESVYEHSVGVSISKSDAAEGVPSENSL